MTEPTPAQRLIGDFAPKLVELTAITLARELFTGGAGQ
jgi:hypothetical protein